MKTMRWMACAGMALTLAYSVRADDANSDAAKAIKDIEARRAEKAEARSKQTGNWAQGEGRERGLFQAGGAVRANVNPGQTIQIIEKK